MSQDHTIRAAPYQPRRRFNPGEAARRYGPPAALFIAALMVVLGGWLLFTSTRIEIQVVEQDGSALAASPDVGIQDGFSIEFGQARLMREGSYRINITADGYEPLSENLLVDSDSDFFEFRLERLPGLLSVSSEPPGAVVSMNGTEIGATPFSDKALPAGDWTLVANLPLHTPIERQVEIRGRGVREDVQLIFTPNFARLTLTSSPSGAELLVDRAASGVTPVTLELEAGSRSLTFRKAGYASRTIALEVVSGQNENPPTVALRKASASLRVASEPSGAVVLLNGQYQGLSPLELSVQPEQTHRIRLRKTGYEEASQALRLSPGASKDLRLELQQSLGEVIISVSPEDATLLVDGREQRQANTRLQLTSEPHRLEFRRLGYESVIQEITPRTGFTQRVDVQLVTLEDARLARLKPEIVAASNQTLVLLKPTPIELGASRREAGRRANEVLRKVPMSREYYLATSEVSNAQFRAFARGHTSGSHAGHSLNDDKQPAVGISWLEAARYCNWLSEQDGLAPVYDVHASSLRGWDFNRSGYRLPTEAEWAWAARFVAPGQPLLRMPWGEGLNPPERHGNYADTSASYVVSRVIFGYNDNYIVSAPVASFTKNAHGLFDMGGNVSEWVHDYYEQTPASQQPPDAAGPADGEYHVIRGSSWTHGGMSDLRLSYRDYGAEGRADLGFRIAKYAE